MLQIGSCESSGGQCLFDVDAEGNVLVADCAQHIDVWDNAGTFLASRGENDALGDPISVAVDDAGRQFVLDAAGHRVVVLDPSGAVIASWGELGNGEGQFRQAMSDVAVDSQGNVYVSSSTEAGDNFPGVVQKFRLLPPLLPPGRAVATPTAVASPASSDTNLVEGWHLRDGGTCSSDSVAVGDTVYVLGCDEIGENGLLRALDAATGAKRWEFTGPTFSAVAVSGDLVYVDDLKGVLYALAIATGEERWHHNGLPIGDITLVVDSDVLVVASYSPQAFAQGSGLIGIDTASRRGTLALPGQRPERHP